MTAPVICFGEMLLRLNCAGAHRFSQTSSFEASYAGSEANVAVLLSRLNTPVALVTSLPKNDLGGAALQTLRQHGIPTNLVHQAEGRMGLFFTESGAGIRAGNIIYDRHDSCFAQVEPGAFNWKEIFNNASWFHWSGISPAVSEGAARVSLEALKAARKAGITISADFNYRSKLWAYGKKPSEVMPELLSYCDVVYGDIDTAEIYFGIKKDRSLSREAALQTCISALKEKLPSVKAIAMSFREQTASGSQRYSGVLWNERLYSSKAFDLGTVVERIGTGDAFMGALIFALIQKYDPQKSIDFAVAAGALKHSISGDAAIVHREEIESLVLSGSIFGKINR